MVKDGGGERMRQVTRQLLLGKDELANYPSYRWPTTCPACPAPRGGGGTVRLPDRDGVRGGCVLCGAPLTVERFGRIADGHLSGSCRANA